MSEDLSAYINDLDAPTLMAELRCLAGSLGNTLDELDGLSQMAIAFRALCVGLSRFDSSTDHPLPIAVDPTECRCKDPEGLGSRLNALLTETRAAAMADLTGGLDLTKLVESIRDQLPEGVNVGQIVAVPMRGDKPAGEPVVLSTDGAEDEPPAPGLYL